MYEPLKAADAREVFGRQPCDRTKAPRELLAAYAAFGGEALD